MDNKLDFNIALPGALEEEKEKVKEDCKEMAEVFEIKSSAVSEGQGNVVFHLEFNDVEKLGKFLEYLQARGVLQLDEVHTKNGAAN